MINNDERAVLVCVTSLITSGAPVGSRETMLSILAARTEYGAGTYGALKLRTDPRSFLQEAREELCDALFYLGAEFLLATGDTTRQSAIQSASVLAVRAWSAIEGLRTERGEEVPRW